MVTEAVPIARVVFVVRVPVLDKESEASPTASVLTPYEDGMLSSPGLRRRVTALQSGHCASALSGGPRGSPQVGLPTEKRATQLRQILEFRNSSLGSNSQKSVLSGAFCHPEFLVLGSWGSAPSGHILTWASKISTPEKSLLSDGMVAFSVAGVLG